MKPLSMLHYVAPTVKQVFLPLWIILVSTLILPSASAGRISHLHDQIAMVVADFNVHSHRQILHKDGSSGEVGLGEFNEDGSPEVLYRSSICGTTALWSRGGILLRTDSLVSSPGSLYLDESSDSIEGTEWGTIWCYVPTSSDHPLLILRPIDNPTASNIQIRASPKINV